MIAPSDNILKCPACKAVLPWHIYNTAGAAHCPSCQAEIYAAAFPALYRPVAAPATVTAPAGDGESACFHHPAKKAEAACDMCGRFMCSLCHIQLGAHHICPSCVETGRKKQKLESVSNQRKRHDDRAYALAVYPLIFFPVTIITAPIALTLAIWKWNAPVSILGRSRVKMVVAAGASLLQIAIWCAGIIYFLRIQEW